MYGHIHCIVRELLQVKFGMDKWYEVLNYSGVSEDELFEVLAVYDDATTFKVLEAATTVLGVPLNVVLRELGVYFVTYALKHGYGTILLTLGHDMVSFISNLDSMHAMLSLSYRGMVAPSFRCEENADGSLTVHYYSWRNGLFAFVQGLVEAVAKKLFNQVARLTLLSTEKVEVDTGKFQYHSVIKLELQTRSHGGGLVSGKSYNPNKPRVNRRRLSVEQQISALAHQTPIMTVEDQSTAFPYHMLLDQDMRLLQCGEGLRERLAPRTIITPGDTPLRDLATISLPTIAPTFRNVCSFINSVFCIDVSTGDHSPPLVLKGQFMLLPDCGHLLFMGSPHLLSWNDFKRMNVTMADIPLFDCTRELVPLNQQRIAQIDVAKRLDETTKEFKKMSQALEAEKQKTEELLHEMMPRKMAMQLTLYGRVKAEKYKWSTVLFSDIVTFSDITARCQADQVLTMLNDMHHRFHTHTQTHQVYKVKTIGDVYMAVTGVPEVQEDHAERMADFAMDMLEEAANVPSPATGRPLQIRVGLHTGTVVAGVIGKKKPRFDIYGDTVSTASLMDSNSVAGRIQVSEPTFEQLYPMGYVFKSRGQVDMKGKGKMATYFLVGTLDRDLEQPEDQFTSLPDVLDPEAESKPPQRNKMVKRALLPRTTSINIVESRGGAGAKRASASWQYLTNLLRPKKQSTLAPASPSLPSEPSSSTLPPSSTTTAERFTTTPSDLTRPPSYVLTNPPKQTSPNQASPAEAGLAGISPILEVSNENAASGQMSIAPPVSQPARFSQTPFGREKQAPSVLKRIEPAPFLKHKRRMSAKPKKQVYTTGQMNLLPFGGSAAAEESDSSFFDKMIRKTCSIL